MHPESASSVYAGEAMDAEFGSLAGLIIVPVFAGNFLGMTLGRAALKSIFGLWQTGRFCPRAFLDPTVSFLLVEA